MEVRVRIAPSPTGIPHIGNTRTALFNFLFAKKHQGKFLLRIEDTDQKRIVPEAKEAIFEILEWLELKPDEAPYVQSERLDVYRQHIKILLEKKIAYGKDGAVWIKIPKEREFSWNDGVGNKKISFKSDAVEDFVAIKSDGFPTYHFANVVDDNLMKISHVIRGDEWISSTPKHLFLYEAFGWSPPVFAHLPVILGNDRTKLSKRHGAESVLDYRDKGFLKEALLNFMALLGWNPGGDREIMDFKTMISLFDLKDVNTGSPVFDIKKLEWMNGEYIRKFEISNLKFKLLEFDPSLSSTEHFDEYLALAQPRMRTLADFRALVENDEKVSLSKEQKKLATELKQKYQEFPEWKASLISTATIETRDYLRASTKDIYTVLTGKSHGLPFEQKLEIQGKAETFSWFDKVINK